MTTRNVKDSPYNATGDGVTDDTSAIASCISASSSGDTVYFPAGTYIVNTLNIDGLSGLTFLGVETTGTPRPTTWSTILKHKANATNAIFAATATGVTDMEWRYFDFDGNQANQSTARNCISLGGHDIYIGQCRMKDFAITTYGSGVLLGKPTSGYSYNLVTEDCTFVNNGNDWQMMDGTHDCRVENCSFTGCTSEAISMYGPTYPVYNIEAIGNTMDDSYSCIQLDGAHDCLVDSNTITDSPGYIVLTKGGTADTTNNTISNNTLTYGSSFTASTAIAISSACPNNTVSHNTINNFPDPKSPLGLAAAGTVCHGNTFNNCFFLEPHNDNLQITDNTFNGMTYNAIYVRDHTRTGLVISGNTIHDSTRHGISIAIGTTDTVITNNVCYNNGKGLANTYDGINIGTAATNILIAGNVCYDNQGTKTQRRGVTVATSSTGYYCNNNMTGNLNDPTWDGLTELVISASHSSVPALVMARRHGRRRR